MTLNEVNGDEQNKVNKVTRASRKRGSTNSLKPNVLKRNKSVEPEDQEIELIYEDGELTSDEGSLNAASNAVNCSKRNKKEKTKSKNEGAWAVFQEDGDELLMSVKGVEYDSEIDDQLLSTDGSSSEDEESEFQEEQQVSMESSNNNASAISSQRSDAENADNQQLLEEFLWLQKIMQEKGIISEPKTKHTKSPKASHAKRKGGRR